MRYTPGKKKDFTKNVQYSNGLEFMFIDGTEYIGYYHEFKTKLYSGQEHDKNSIFLYPYTNDKNIITYYQLKPIIEYEEPNTFVPSPIEKDYEKGSIKRFFIKKRNDNKIIEINSEQFKSLPIKSKGLMDEYYLGIELDWKITGPLYDIYENNILTIYGIYNTNERTVLLKEKEMKGLSKHFSSFVEFSRIDNQ
jgi:hypothetical protein